MEQNSSSKPEKDMKLNALKANYDRSKFRVNVRFEKEDAEKLAHFAQLAGMDLTTYIRRISLNPTFKIVPVQPKINLETKAEIQKIGINLNQMTRALNNRYEPHDFKQITSELEKISDSLQGILLKLEPNDR